MLIIGLMSGTSADGIDAALVDVKSAGGRIKVALRSFLCIPHTPEVRDAILRTCDPRRGRIPDLCALDAFLGSRFADAAVTVAESAGVALTSVDAIASHGQTVWHQPTPLDFGGGHGRGTVQIGNPAVIAAETGCAVVSDFRSADMAAGGQGAPLVPYADWALFASAREDRAVQNIGGIANATFLPRSAAREEVRAFDTGPGNMVIDGVVTELSHGQQTYDRGGEWAASGNINATLLNRLLEHPFFGKEPPKSTGREEFGAQYVRRTIQLGRKLRVADADLVATVTALTAESITLAYQRYSGLRNLKTVILGGGGGHNATLVRMIRDRLAPARITTHEEFGIPADAKEAVAFAILAYQTLRGRASNIRSATGAAYAAVLGSWTPGPR